MTRSVGEPDEGSPRNARLRPLTRSRCELPRSELRSPPFPLEERADRIRNTLCGPRVIVFDLRCDSTGRPCERRDPYGADFRFYTGAEALFLLLTPRAMGPCVRRDDPLRRQRYQRRSMGSALCETH